MGIRDDELEGGLFEAFKAPETESVLEAIQRLHGAGSSLLLRDAGDDTSPVLLKREEAEDDPRFQILGEIARGGIGIIYKGRDRDLNRDVALKVLRPEYRERQDVIQRFIEEAQVGGQLQHPGIVPVYELGLQADQRPYFAMKLAKGETLAARLARGKATRRDLLAVFREVCRTMAYAHARGVIHRDDLFSLGAILCEILTGKPPYTGLDRMNDAAQARLDEARARLDACDADPKLVALCKRCLQALPKDRPASAEMLADDVAAYLTTAEGRAHRAQGRAHRAQVRALRAEARATEQRRARRLTTLVGGSTLVALVIAAGAYFWIDAGRTQRERDRQAAIESALQDATRLRKARKWTEALAAAQRAIALGDDGALAETIRDEAREAERLVQRRKEERELRAALEEAREMTGDHYGADAIGAAWNAAIRRLWPSMEVDTKRLAESEDAPAFTAAFDAWALGQQCVAEGPGQAIDHDRVLYEEDE